jgi:hypothetical protein
MDAKEIQRRFLECFDPDEVKWKPQSVKGNRALAICYVDARCVMDRLDDVVGVAGWQTQYQQVGPASFECRLSVRIDGEWIIKTDVGNTSDQPDEGDQVKAAYSDAIKRAAVHFGIGRYLYRLGHQWCDYDPQKRQFVKTPELPRWAIPEKYHKPVTASTASKTIEPAPVISKADRILALIKTVVGQKGGDLNEIIAKTCKQYGVSTLADLPNKAADEVLQRLNSKITELAKTPAKDAAG